MTTKVDVEEIQTTKGEKLLASILAIFVLSLLLWAYFNLKVESQAAYPYANGTAAQQRILDRYQAARFAAEGAQYRLERAQDRQVDRREAYRTELDAGNPAPEALARYEAATQSVAAANRRLRAAVRTRSAAKAAAAPVQASMDKQSEALASRASRQRDHDDRETFLKRLALVLLALAASYVAIAKLRNRRSRYMVLAMAWAAATAALALVMTIDYLDPDIEEGSIVGLSLFGIALTVGAFFALQRYLARRLPERRVRKRECPFCAFPVGTHQHCEGCGRTVRESCASCEQERRVGTRHCAICGQA